MCQNAASVSEVSEQPTKFQTGFRIISEGFRTVSEDFMCVSELVQSKPTKFHNDFIMVSESFRIVSDNFRCVSDEALFEAWSSCGSTIAFYMRHCTT